MMNLKQKSWMVKMNFKEIIDNPTIENQIRFKEECIKRIKEDIKLNGDNGFGYKKILIENIEKDIKKLKNENKRIVN